ncbi:MAG: glycosyltransferase family 4 protein [Ruminococcaceae bacterium]|nr:glycosyltransferase family 4 protein [Oscillospiraceae bacterium]
MNILVVTPFFKHDKNIASVRWTNISTRLAKKHNVIVVSQPHDDMDMSLDISKDDDGILVARINQKTAYEKFAVKYFGGATGDDWQTSTNSAEDEANKNEESFVRKMKNRVLFSSMKSKAKSYARYIVKNVIPKDIKIDVVISSACPFIEMLIGYELKRQLKCKWISDFRDLPFVNTDRHDEKIMKKIMQERLVYADAVISIAKKGIEYLSCDIVTDREKIHHITNGFSMADAREPIYKDDGVLHIVHTGSLYGGTRKADLFFKAAQLARQENPEFNYILECAGGNNETLIETAKKYGEENNVKNFGFIPREQALDLQGQADILLALIYKTTGSFSAKLFEYTLNKKPIICVSCGAGDDGEETGYIRELNLGIAVEQTNPDDVKLLCDYLLKQYELKAENLPLYFKPENSLISEYDHDNIVNKIENLCMSIV